MTLMTTDSVAGVAVPDTTLTRAITAHVRALEDDVLYHHSRRVFFFGALQGRRRSLVPDLELLYAGAMFHDVGLTERYRTTSRARFEVDGANAARDFLVAHGVSSTAAHTVWLSIALHTTPEVPTLLEPEVALVTAGVETDVLGVGRDHLARDVLEEVVRRHPRPGFKQAILERFTEGMRRRPHSTFGTMNADVLEHYDDAFVREDFVETVLGSAWPE